MPIHVHFLLGSTTTSSSACLCWLVTCRETGTIHMAYVVNTFAPPLRTFRSIGYWTANCRLTGWMCERNRHYFFGSTGHIQIYNPAHQNSVHFMYKGRRIDKLSTTTGAQGHFQHLRIRRRRGNALDKVRCMLGTLEFEFLTWAVTSILMSRIRSQAMSLGVRDWKYLLCNQP